MAKNTHIPAALEKQIRAIPATPGVYIYKNEKESVIYVGKAVNLARRVSQYFQESYQLQGKIEQLAREITDLTYITTLSEFDALTLEARLIRQYQPRYNSIAKDDRSPLYIVITFAERVPHLLFVRKTAVAEYQINKQNKIFGPFQSATLIRRLLGQVRHIIPFCLQKTRRGKPCFYTHIGLCTPCPAGFSTQKEGQGKQTLIRTYRRNLHNLSRMLGGQSFKVREILAAEMKTEASKEHFEKAALIREQITALDSLLSKHYDPSFYLASDLWGVQSAEEQLETLKHHLAPYYKQIENLTRIECVDISNLGGGHATGSLVVLTGGLIDSSQYRRFKIRLGSEPNDFAMIREVLTRRFAHPGWQLPNLLVIDGGKGQVGEAKKVLALTNLAIPVIGLAKRFEEVVIPVDRGFKVLRLSSQDPGLQLLERLRDEAHRFALTYHRALRRKN